MLSVIILCFTYEAACTAVARFRTFDKCRTGLMCSDRSCVKKHVSHIENEAMSGNQVLLWFQQNQGESLKKHFKHRINLSFKTGFQILDNPVSNSVTH